MSGSSLPGTCHLTCPVCDRRLEREGATFRCAVGHSFDIAREGYVNLLISRHRPRGLQGDLPQMLRSRRRFLEEGYYAALLDHLSALVLELLDGRDRDNPCLVELGCGEGYYIGGIARALRERSRRTHQIFGMDLSKDAVRMAAKRYPEATFFVGDINRRIYLPDASVDILLNIFAPRNPSEFGRILAPGGHAVIVIPAPHHLRSLREEFGLLEIQEEKEQLLLDRFSVGFRLLNRTELEFRLELPPGAVEDLIAMGPSQWHREPGWSLPADYPPTVTEAAFIVLCLQRLPNPYN